MNAVSLVPLFKCNKCEDEPLVSLTTPGPLTWVCARCQTRYRYDRRSQRLEVDTERIGFPSAPRTVPGATA